MVVHRRLRGGETRGNGGTAPGVDNHRAIIFALAQQVANKIFAFIAVLGRLEWQLPLEHNLRTKGSQQVILILRCSAMSLFNRPESIGKISRSMARMISRLSDNCQDVDCNSARDVYIYGRASNVPTSCTWEHGITRGLAVELPLFDALDDDTSGLEVLYD